MSIRDQTRRDFLKALGLGAAAMAVPRWTMSAKRPAKRPNFVFILIDDMGWMDSGCYGSTFYETPNIDKLASEGVRFTDAYAACPVCSPTRASILAGKYPARINLTNFIAGRRGGMLVPPDFELQMRLTETTIAEALREAGYATCFVGKWHLGDEPYLPENQGFDTNVAGNRWGQPPSYFWPYKRGDFVLDLPGGKEGEYLTDRLTDEALKFMEANRDRPFLLYLSHYAVHTPLQSKKELESRYEAKAAKIPSSDKPKYLPEGNTRARQIQDHPVYSGMIESTDDSVGRVLRKLRELGISDNTVVIFMSDNGGLSTSEGWPTSNVPLRGGKGWLYEGGIREPMIIKWPGVAQPGSICSEPVTSTDFYPTMLEMAGLSLRPEQHVDGISLVPLLKGAKSLDRGAIFWHYPHYSNQGGTPGGAVRAGDYKLIEFYEDDRVELYDLADDLGEKHDLAPELSDKARELRGMLDEWLRSVDAQMPTPNPRYGKLEPGSKDSEFDILRDAAVDGSELGYRVRGGWQKTGIALKKLPQPLRKRGIFELRLQSATTEATRNGFLAFGEGTEDSELVKCGLYLGGRRAYAIVDGPFDDQDEKTVALELDWARVFELAAEFDIEANTVRLTADAKTVEKTLSLRIGTVTYVGYCARDTVTDFGPIKVSGE